MTKEEAEEKKASDKARAAERAREKDGGSVDEDDVDGAGGEAVLSLSTYMVQGLELEDQQ